MMASLLPENEFKKLEMEILEFSGLPKDWIWQTNDIIEAKNINGLIKGECNNSKT
jgi:hypothetical protein